MPPACMSKVSPRYFIDIAEHSMCQPGRPRPIGVSHAGSSRFGAFHSAKSRASSFSYLSVSTRSLRAGDVALKVDLRKLSVFGKRSDAVVDRVVGSISVVALLELFDQCRPSR